MKIVKCPICKREKEIKDNIVIAICPVCQTEMIKLKEGDDESKHYN